MAQAVLTPLPPFTRRLGNTGLTVSAIGLGLAALGRPMYMTLGRERDFGRDRSVETMAGRCYTVLDAAYHAGIRYVDTARSYGLAERFVAEWCDRRRLPPSALTVGSKWGYRYTGGWRCDCSVHEIKDLSLDTLQHQAAESRAVLGRRLSLYQIHSATLESGVLDDCRVLAELARMREKGTHIGLTATGPRQAEIIKRALTIRIDGAALFATVQATWNLLEPSAADALAEARAAGVGVIVKEVLANGRLTDRHADAALCDVRAYAAAYETTIEAVAVAAALAQPWADVVLSGAVSCEQLGGHLAALDLPIDGLPAGAAAEGPAEYWQRRAAVPWT